MFHGSSSAEPVYLACLWSVHPAQDAVCSPTNQLYTIRWHLNVWISRYLIQNRGILSLLHGQFSNFYGMKFCLSIPVSMLSIQGLLRILCCPTQRIFLGFFSGILSLHERLRVHPALQLVWFAMHNCQHTLSVRCLHFFQALGTLLHPRNK